MGCDLVTPNASRVCMAQDCALKVVPLIRVQNFGLFKHSKYLDELPCDMACCFIWQMKTTLGEIVLYDKQVLVVVV